MSKIEWTQKTWNPVVGCSVKSPGCINCYAMPLAHRLGAMATTAHYAGLTETSKAGPVFTGKVAQAPEKTLLEPLRRKVPTIYFVNSMGDLFHENVPIEWIDRVFAVMALCPQHTFQVLTKRAERMRDYCANPETPFRIPRAMDALSASDAGEEEVLPIAGYPGYFASSRGFIYSEKRGSRRRMKPDAGEQGHLRVQLHREWKESRRGDRLLVHRIILKTFVGPAPTPDAQGRHRDGNPQNNAVANLSWGDQGENWADSKRHGTHRRYSKLTDEQAIEIRRRHGAESGEALAREFGVSATQIRNIAAGKQWAIAAPIEWPLKQIWLGVSAERQKEADERIPHLLQTPAAIRFVSCEPLLDSIDLTKINIGNGFTINTLTGINLLPFGHFDEAILNWVIVGGESGHRARPLDFKDAIPIKNLCEMAGIPFFFKGWGEWWHERQKLPAPIPPEVLARCRKVKWSDGSFSYRVGKGRAGRYLDGKLHDAMPEVMR